MPLHIDKEYLDNLKPPSGLISMQILTFPELKVPPDIS
jgi:hypothetical protein